MQKLSVKEIKEILNSNDEEKIKNILEELKNDERKAVATLLNSYKNKQRKMMQKTKAFEEKKEFDFTYSKGKMLVGGVDEVGRGPFAGPVVAACVILKDDFHHLDIDDSKKIKEEKRNELFDYIIENSISIGVGMASPNEIDELNILEATKLAMKRAITAMKQKPDMLLLDAVELNINIQQKSFIKGDEKSLSIGAASIIAKVTRDRLMYKLDKDYPEYDFSNNKGYGTSKHIDGIKKYGIIENVHRKTFTGNFT